jgi:hypothetical protein
MSIDTLLILVPAVIVGLVIAFVIYRRVPKKLKVDKFIEDWKELQSYCKDKTTWPKAIEEADHLLDAALRRRKFKGKSMGERMVSAQRVINNNDQLWFAHNLAKKVIADPAMKLKEADVKTALIGFRQALKDLGALQNSEASVTNTAETTKGAK